MRPLEQADSNGDGLVDASELAATMTACHGEGEFNRFAVLAADCTDIVLQISQTSVHALHLAGGCGARLRRFAAVRSNQRRD